MVDPRTRKRIQRMAATARREYAAVIGVDLERAEAKRQRLAHDIRCTPNADDRRPKESRLKRLDAQIASLRSILAYVERYWPTLRSRDAGPSLNS